MSSSLNDTPMPPRTSSAETLETITTGETFLAEKVFHLVIPYRTPNNANARKNWKQIMQEKHRCQDVVMSELRSVVRNSSTLTPSILPPKIYSTALQVFESYLETRRKKSLSKSTNGQSKKARKRKPSSKSLAEF